LYAAASNHHLQRVDSMSLRVVYVFEAVFYNVPAARSAARSRHPSSVQGERMGSGGAEEGLARFWRHDRSISVSLSSVARGTPLLWLENERTPWLRFLPTLFVLSSLGPVAMCLFSIASR
jgi:hypothetical protein